MLPLDYRRALERIVGKVGARMTKLAADMSNWGGALTDDEAQCFMAHGYALIIAGTQDATIFRQQVDAAQRNGLRAQAYVYLNWDRADAQVRASIAMLAGTDCELLWLDVEDSTTALAPEEIIEILRHCIAACGEIPCGIYTSVSKWRELTGDSQAFANLPLWSAYYDDDPDIDFAKDPYGGWAAPTIEQFGNTQDVCGQSVDENVINEEMEHMPTQEYDTLYQRDEDIKVVLADTRAKVLELGRASFELAAQVYGDSDPKTLDLKQRVDALEAAQQP